MSKPLVDFSRKLANVKLSGDVHYFVAKVVERNNAISLLAEEIERQDNEIVELRCNLKEITDKLIARM